MLYEVITHGVAVQTLGKMGGARHEAADLRIDTAADAADVRGDRHMAFGQRFSYNFV